MEEMQSRILAYTAAVLKYIENVKLVTNSLQSELNTCLQGPLWRWQSLTFEETLCGNVLLFAICVCGEKIPAV
jgi:hypothetical protein